LDLLENAEHNFSSVQEKIVKSKAASLEQLLTEFNVNAAVVAADTGPVVTMFELKLAPGIKVSQISSLTNDMARALGVGAVRVVAPLPGKHTIGIEVPNNEKEKVRIKDLLTSAGNACEKMHIPLFLGKDSAGDPLVSDLAGMPHVLIAGTTGSGKSVCINSIITSILMTRRPDEVKMILVDPKMVEMTSFNNVPHLMCPIVTETNRAVQILEWATVKMDERYALLAEARVRNIADFNKLGTEEIIARFEPSNQDEEAQIPKKLPYIVVVIDELADLMMTAAKEIESYIVRLAQKSRAVGIHLVVATQRPQATVETGLIKSNMPTRIGFRVAARMDSRIILDQNGAETLLGQGDMLFLKPGTSDLIRAQGTFIDDAEVWRIVKHLKEIAEPQFHPELSQLGRIDPSKIQRDDMFDQAVEIVLETKRGSVSLLQRRLAIGYARASRIIEMMAAAGILGEYKGSQAREVLMSRDEYNRIKNQMSRDAAAGYSDMQEDDEEEAEPAYVNEGQLGYAAIDDEEEYEEEAED
jgi:S-DNA-T family DNA segregation ATPase FtsK/SpoIIIE